MSAYFEEEVAIHESAMVLKESYDALLAEFVRKFGEPACDVRTIRLMPVTVLFDDFDIARLMAWCFIDALRLASSASPYPCPND